MEVPTYQHRSMRSLDKEDDLILQHGPTRLHQLEAIAKEATSYMEPHPDARQYSIDRIRQLFNLEFKMCCGNCGTAQHYQDESSAPER